MTDLDRLLEEARGCRDWLRYSAIARKVSAMLPKEIRIALLGGATTDTIEHPLRLALAEVGIAADLHLAPFGLFYTELIDPESSTAAFGPRIAIVLLTPSNIPCWPEPDAGVEGAAAVAEEVASHFLSACERLHARCGAEIILGNFHQELCSIYGNLGAKLPGERNNFIRRVNAVLGDRAPSYVHLCDVALLAARHGIERWFDPRLWHQAKQPISPEWTAELVRNIAAIAGALLGKGRKVLAVDLDNTLWGGVIGDDGLEGIELGEGSPLGEAYKEVQKYLLALTQRGVLLAVVSKNEPQIAMLPFREHPETVLRPEHFAAIRANWNPKSDNLESLAEELDVGLQAFVLLDDNPAEREEVRRALPDVAVLEVGEDPVDYPRAIERGRYFEPVVVTEEDRNRCSIYRTRRATKALETSATDLSGFLASLEMKAVVEPFEPVSMGRIVQLINKTNQFNLTTQRMTASEVEAIANDAAWIHRSVRLSDRFGDHGLISILMGRIEASTLVIQNWLMSCRVLKRGVENLLLEEIVAAARAHGLRELVGLYVPTERNGLVKDHYRALGFVSEGESRRWRLALEGFDPARHFIAREERDGERG